MVVDRYRGRRGATMADVGCGRGVALIRLDEACPKSTCVGFDAFGPTIKKATAKAEAAGVGDRVRCEERDGSAELPQQFDIVATFDVVHDADIACARGRRLGHPWISRVEGP